jgi:hypothetical protein
MQLLTHLYTTYGVITPIDIEDNDTRMREPFDPTLPIETLFDQIESAVEYADAGNRAYNPKQVVSRAYLLILQTGMYPDACRDWRRRDLVDQTWPNFKTDFSEAHRDLRIVQTAAQGAGYHSANSAMTDIQENYRRETSAALGQLASATAADRTAVANLTQANTNLSTQLGSANDSIETLKQTITTLQAQLGQLSLSNNNNQSTDTNGRNRNRTNNNTNQSYCWTHGRTRNDQHTSQSCRHPDDTHKAKATLHNRLGGSDKWCAEK